MNSRRVEIPATFHSTVDKTPFSTCLVCERSLLQEPLVPYMIEKNVRRYPELNREEVIFEFAICQPCQQVMSEALSKESRERISTYFQEHLSPSQIEANLQKSDRSPDDSIQDCMLSGEAIQTCTEYSLYAQCQGEEMEMNIFPFALSGKVLEQMAELLSDRSREEMDDFMGHYFTGPPEFNDILKPKPRLIF